MNPHQRNKIDISVSSPRDPLGFQVASSHGDRKTDVALRTPQKLSEEEQKIFRLYGKMPNTKDLLQNKFKVRPLHSNTMIAFLPWRPRPTSTTISPKTTCPLCIG